MASSSSVVTVQLGQCGNQLGMRFFDRLHSEVAHGGEEGEARFFWRPRAGGVPRARCVLVDMEPKVVDEAERAAAATGRWRYARGGSLARQGGSANNWSYGFGVHGPEVRDGVLELVRREAERCDRLAGLKLLQSLAGGTGSGLGAYLTQAVRDEYPHASLLNSVVWPYTSGEVIVQNYNAALTLSHLNEFSDAVVTVENDHLLRVCTRALGIKRPSFDDLNAVAAHDLASVCLPAACGPGGRAFCPLLDGVPHVAAHPGYKLTGLRTVPQTPDRSKEFDRFTWPYVVDRLRRMHRTGAATESAIRWSDAGGGSPSGGSAAAAAVLVLRGAGAARADTSAFGARGMFAPWTAEPLLVAASERRLRTEEVSGTLWASSRSVAEPLERVVAGAFQKFRSRAYVHHYTKHGVTTDHFEAHFARLEQVLHNYRRL